jgi:hypothetical protein
MASREGASDSSVRCGDCQLVRGKSSEHNRSTAIQLENVDGFSLKLVRVPLTAVSVIAKEEGCYRHRTCVRCKCSR